MVIELLKTTYLYYKIYETVKVRVLFCFGSLFNKHMLYAYYKQDIIQSSKPSIKRTCFPLGKYSTKGKTIRK